MPLTYAVAMVVHILGVVALMGAFILLNQVGPRLRRAARHEEARPWAELLLVVRAMMPAGAAMLLLSGGYLASRLGARPPAWVVVAAVDVLLIGAVALGIVGPWLGAAHRAVAAGDGALGTDARRAIARPAVPPAVAAANGMALGTLWLMTARPGPAQSLLVVGTLATAGALIGLRQARRARRARG